MQSKTKTKLIFFVDKVYFTQFKNDFVILLITHAIFIAARSLVTSNMWIHFAITSFLLKITAI